ncbi:N-acetylmuramoyl-L-alanine amidase [Trichococcus collinsii]|uniref:N-acetylmuramoyl-L-alanine amidase n=1 Tax=Trichococcus collinsii TaxID=157076 RepID=A0AB38A424_9LACT|nr:N-acetylmuramoyl-L-alanine amidase [Trichococcus collinsii]CZQ97871.1 cell wall hydrolase/autolysin catalytic [Trichococcus collinsii]SEA97088.1 N-acetylmuramoyl-L-alanine amidase [Trichococcus collinsii]
MPTLEEIKNKVIEVWESDHIILPSVTAAQFILESASGNSTLANATNNLFGIKASPPWSGEVYYHETNEEVDKSLLKVTDGFRKYATWQDSVQDHSKFFTSTETRKKVYAKVIGETDYTKVCNALTGTYATDSSYGEKLITIIKAKGLDAWDKETGGKIMGRKIFIDDGHGGTDNGATGNGILEDAWNLEVCSMVEYELIALGHQVMSTRSTDIYVGLSERAIMANNWGAEIFISCHVNAGGGAGYEDFIYNALLSTDTDTPRLQDCIHASVTAVTNNYGLKNRGQKTANYAVLRETYMPAILLEAGFLDNGSDAAILKNNQFKKEYAHAVVVGILNYFGLSSTVTPSTPIVNVQAAVRIPASYNATVKSGGYSIDSKPWGEVGFTQWGMTDAILGNSIYVYEESESGEYVNAYQVGWIDKRAIEKEKVVIASTLYLPNGETWIVYPENGPYEVGYVVRIDGSEGSWYTILGDRENDKVVVDLPTVGRKAILFEAEKGATITKVLG